MADARQTLEELLAALGESSQFVTSGSVPPVLPGLVVQGLDSIGSPVSAADARRLISKASQAPYGRGEETIVDTNVRRVWELEPAEFCLENSQWDATIAAIIDAVRQDFGIRQKVKPELYKLLIYEKGSFFAPHRDTEKTRRMFATLVVCLPSRHAGGTLVVRHEGQSRRIDLGGKGSEFKAQYAAFYADCEHEIEPVAEGYRICLIYNLATAGKKQPAAPQNAAVVAQAAELLSALFSNAASELSKIAIPFQHQYTAAGLDPTQLKGSDRARADVLVRAAKSLDYECNYALLTQWESGEPDYETMDYDPYRRRDSYGWSDDEDEEEEDDVDSDGSRVEMGEVFDANLSLDHWLDPQGRQQRFGEIHLEEREVLCLSDREDWSFRQEIQEATGNAGVSMEHWYRQGVIVIWPREQTFRILAGEGQSAALPELERLVARSKSPATLAACGEFASALVDHWQPRQQAPTGKTAYPQRMLKVLQRLGVLELTQQFIRDVLPKDFDGSEGEVLLRLGQQLGWTPLGKSLRQLIDQQKPADFYSKLAPIVDLCLPLCCDPPPLTDDRRAVCMELADALALAIQRWDKKGPQFYGSGETRVGVVESTLRIFSALAATEQLDGFLTHVLSDQQNYDLRAVLIPDVKAIYQWLPKVPAAQAAAARLWQYCQSELQAATARPIEPPSDWAREAKLGCTCADCKALSRFLANPSARVGRFPLRKDRRQHLHQQIDKQRCDCTHVTQRQGSPQTLVCTKNQASYERRLKQYQSDQQLIADLDALANPRAKPRKPPTKKRTSKK